VFWSLPSEVEMKIYCDAKVRDQGGQQLVSRGLVCHQTVSAGDVNGVVVRRHMISVRCGT